MVFSPIKHQAVQIKNVTNLIVDDNVRARNEILEMRKWPINTIRTYYT
jgi:hypothetical protein